MHLTSISFICDAAADSCSHYATFWYSWQKFIALFTEAVRIWGARPRAMCSGPYKCSSPLTARCPHLRDALILRLHVSARWRRWTPAACSWRRSSWLVSTRHCSSMTCVASRCHGNIAVLGAFSTGNFFRASWPEQPATGPPCWTCARGRQVLCACMRAYSIIL